MVEISITPMSVKLAVSLECSIAKIYTLRKNEIEVAYIVTYFRE